MDLSYFGMTRRPFRPTPDTFAYFASPTHSAALNGLELAFQDREGVAVIDGEAGTGKTLVALKFLESLDSAVPRLLVPSPRFARPADLFQALLFDIGIDYRGLNEQELRLAVIGHLLETLVTVGPTVVVFDEAQHLTVDALEEIRLLGNLETRSEKAVFTVLLGQIGLRQKLGPALAQRASLKCKIDPLTFEESAAYLASQLRLAGGNPDRLLAEEAAQLLAVQCKGIPRLLNQAASLSFTLAGIEQASGVDVEAAAEALHRLGIAADSTDELTLLPHPAKRKPKAGRRKSA